MKSFYVIVLFSILSINMFSQNWINFNKTEPGYHFALPEQPNIMDTLNIRLTWLNYNSTTVFQVLEFKDTPLDSANAGFNSALQQTNGDTLLAIAQSVAAGISNSSITSSQIISTYERYKGLEVSIKYNDVSAGKELIIYTRYFYNIHTLLSFSITGQEDQLTQLLNNKSQFFNSISLNSQN